MATVTTTYDAAILDTLAGLLDSLTVRGIRLGLSVDRKRVTVDAPEDALTPDLRAAIKAHKSALLAALTATPAPAREGLHICKWGSAHYPHWRHHEGERRLVCASCYPTLWSDATPTGNRVDLTSTIAATSAPSAHMPAPVQSERRAALLAWGAAHVYPALPFAWSTGAGTHRAAYKAIRAGAEGWRIFTAGASRVDLTAACAAAGLDVTPEDPSTGTPETPEAPTAPAPAPATPDAAPQRTRAGRGAAETLAVLDATGLWIARPDEAIVCITDGVPAPSPALHAGELLDLAQRHDIHQLWLHADYAAAAGLPDRLRGVKPREGLAHAFTDGALAAGWDIRPKSLAPWLHCFRPGTYGAIALALPHLDVQAPWHKARDGRELLAALLAYREALGGYGYRYSPAVTGTGLLRALHKGSRIALDLSASVTPQDFPPPARAGHAAPDLIWARPLTSAEREHCLYVNAYDKNGQYLGACASLPVGLGVPEHCEGEHVTFDKKLAGYWRARIAYTPPEGLPNPFAAPIHPTDSEGVSWYLSPALELAYQVGAEVTLLEAYVWRSSPRGILTPWYERLRDARASLLERAASAATDAIALATVKATYRHTIGRLNGGWLRNSETPEDLYRPDWRDAVMAQAAANLYRELLKVQRETGRVPFALDTDCAYFAASSADAIATCPAPFILGDGLRHVKVKTSGAPLAPVAALLDTLCGAGARANRIIDELQTTLQATRQDVSQGEEA